MNPLFKTCGRCGAAKPVDQFYRKARKSGGWLRYCKPCFNAYSIERFRQRKRDAVAYLGGQCADCGLVFPVAVFEFHHRDPRAKELTFTKLRGRAWKTITTELDKCDLLCANCHRKRHWEGEKARPPKYDTERARARKEAAVRYLGGSCFDCGENFPYYVFEFHHRDAASKQDNFRRVRNRAWETVLEELAKCDLLCANCHRKRHWDLPISRCSIP
jgi:NAD-dependent dihydropyrimidine dehydrogenase PreA subunit